MSEPTKTSLGIDIGGTKIAVSVANARGDVLASARVPSGASRPYEEVLPEIVKAAKEVCVQAGVALSDLCGCGICAPGPLDIAHGRMFKSPNMCWDNVPVRDDVAEALEIPVFFDNDANGGVLAEWFFGSAKGCRDFIFLTMSTGIGGGIIANGQLLQGKVGQAGELGHVILDMNGPICSCGMRGCLEAYCGGRSVARRLRRMMSQDPVPGIMNLPEVHGDLDNLAYPALREAARQGVPLAVEMWDEICIRLAQGIGIHMMAFNPEVIALGTLAMYSGSMLLDRVRYYLPRFAWPEFHRNCRLVPTALGQRIGDLAGPSVALYGLYEQRQWTPWE